MKGVLKWALKREFPDLNVPGMNDWKIDDSIKSLSELKEKLTKDNDENISKFGINIGKDNKISFLANRADNIYSAKNIDELLKKIID